MRLATHESASLSMITGSPYCQRVIDTSDNDQKVRHIYHNGHMKRLPSDNAIRHASEVFKGSGAAARMKVDSQGTRLSTFEDSWWARLDSNQRPHGYQE